MALKQSQKETSRWGLGVMDMVCIPVVGCHSVLHHEKESAYYLDNKMAKL